MSGRMRQDHASCSEAAQRAAGAWDALLEPFQHHAGVAARTSSRSSQARRFKEHTTFERQAQPHSSTLGRHSCAACSTSDSPPAMELAAEMADFFLHFGCAERCRSSQQHRSSLGAALDVFVCLRVLVDVVVVVEFGVRLHALGHRSRYGVDASFYTQYTINVNQ